MSVGNVTLENFRFRTLVCKSDYYTGHFQKYEI